MTNEALENRSSQGFWLKCVASESIMRYFRAEGITQLLILNVLVVTEKWEQVCGKLMTSSIAHSIGVTFLFWVTDRVKCTIFTGEIGQIS